jgi:hypothetical protein
MSDQCAEFTKNNPGLAKNLMTGLIYPAVLGTFIYTSLDQIVRQARLILSGTAIQFDDILALKFGLFFVTLAFYFGDYLYIYFTKTFKWSFFFCDIVFVMGMLVTMAAIDIERPSGLPNIWAVLSCYFLFTVLYLAWDYSELRACEENDPEIPLYREIINWELLSIALLFACAVMIYIYGVKLSTSISLLAILVWMTYRLWHVTLKKGTFYKE